MQLPRYGFQIFGHTAVLNGGNFGSQIGHQCAGFVIAAQWFEHEARGLEVFCAARQIGGHDRGRLPVDHFYLAVTSTLALMGGAKRGGGYRYGSRSPQ